MLSRMSLTLRPAKQEEAGKLSKICFDAFEEVGNRYGVPNDIPDQHTSDQLFEFLLGAPLFRSVVAEQDGRLIGSAFLSLGEIGGIGPVTVATDVQNVSAGRRMMEHLIESGKEMRGLRLVQSAFHPRSLALYAKLGFEVREPLACLTGSPPKNAPQGIAVRPATMDDVEAADRVCREVHGHTRSAEFAGAVHQEFAKVAERDGEIVGYTCGIGFFAHSAALDNDTMKALICDAEVITGPGLLLPARNSDLLQWCLAHGLKIHQMMTLMSKGFYQEPRGAALCSVLF